MSKKDYYKILEIEKNATEEDIKKNYRKLALKYHPDKNQGDDNMFKEISEAYSILSNPDKRKQYDIIGDVDDNFNDIEDPFHIFNNIFQQHMQSFMNMQYDNNININSIINNIPGFQNAELPFGNVHVRVHTFPVDISNNSQNPLLNNIFNMNNTEKNWNENDNDDDDVEDINMGDIFSKLFGKLKQNKKNTKLKKEEYICIKPPDIVYNIEVSLSEIYEQDNKKITINRKRLKNDKYINKKKIIEIPIYAKEILLKEQGDELKNYKEKGDIIINIFNKKEDNFKRINEYDVLTFVNIEINKLYNAFCYELILPNKEVLFVQTEKMNLGKTLLQRINKKGMPYKDDNDKWLKGNLYIMYNVIYPDNINLLKNIKEYHEETTINEYFHIAYNSDISEIFME
jgi:DnaJ-class molecular chaperone